MTRDTMANVKESHVIILFISFLVLLMSFQCKFCCPNHSIISQFRIKKKHLYQYLFCDVSGAKNEHTDVSPLADYSIKDCGKAGCVYDDIDNQHCWCGITKIPECCYVHHEDCDWALKNRQLRPKCKKPAS
ncbi:hypothetical protein Hdeb2414_s0006g00188311 [Helianthus debilis subsp. tardiflorus]